MYDCCINRRTVGKTITIEKQRLMRLKTLRILYGMTYLIITFVSGLNVIVKLPLSHTPDIAALADKLTNALEILSSRRGQKQETDH